MQSSMTTVRQATINDVQILIDFQLKMAQETEQVHLDRNTVKQGVTRVFCDSSKGNYVVAEEKKTVVGCLLITYEWSDWRNGTIWWIQSVYIDPKYRNKGVFSQMYVHLKKKVTDADDVLGLRLYVDKSNADAQSTYRALGMNAEHYLLYEWMNGR